MVSGLNFLSDNYSLIFPGTLLSFLESFTFIYSYSINMFDKTELKTQDFFGEELYWRVLQDNSMDLRSAMASGHRPNC